MEALGALPDKQESNNTTQEQSHQFCELPDVSLSDELQEMYDRLLNLARTPVRHAVQQEEAGCAAQYQHESDYKAIEAKV